MSTITAKKFVSGDGLIVKPWERAISSFTSELFDKWVFKITVLLQFNIILLSLDHFSAEEMGSVTLFNLFCLIGW